MRTNWVRKLRFLTVLVTVSLAFAAVPAAPAGATVAYSVSGTVYHDGSPMPGIEVFVFAGDPYYTCTDANGEYTIADLPTQPTITAAGSSVDAPFCANEKAVDPFGNPLLPALYFGPFTDDTTVDLTLTPLPYRTLLLNVLARSVLTAHYDLANDWLEDLLFDLYSRNVDRAVLSGRIAGPIADAHEGYRNHLCFIVEGPCG